MQTTLNLGKEDKNLKLHKQANDVKLPDEQQRLKTDSSPRAKRKYRPPVDYDIHFTDLKDLKAATLPEELPDSLSDEDLPASIVPAGGPPKSSKRRRDDEKVEPSDGGRLPEKRLRQSQQASMSAQQCLSGSSHTSRTYEETPREDVPLFLLCDSSDDEGSIEVSSPVPSIRAAKLGESTESHEPGFGKQRLLLDVSERMDKPADLTVPNTNPKEVAAPESTDHDMDEFAELEAWLNSGAFEVL